MHKRGPLRRLAPVVICMAVLATFALEPLQAQRGRGAGAPPAPPTGRPGAPIDLTGYWVSLITEDWRYRMVTPPKGEALNAPITAEARKILQAYDPDQDEAAGEQCRAYGAPGVMRMPTRLHITWQDDNTLKIETDTGQQTRLLRFGGITDAANAPPSWQGYSVAAWEVSRAPRGTWNGIGGGTGGGGNATAPIVSGKLKVTTTRLRPGYLRTNGLPYSENAVLTEYFHRHTDRGVDYIMHARIVEDPRYLAEPWAVTSHFKKEPDGSKWAPTPCAAGRPFK